MNNLRYFFKTMRSAGEVEIPKGCRHFAITNATDAELTLSFADNEKQDETSDDTAIVLPQSAYNTPYDTRNYGKILVTSTGAGVVTIKAIY